MVGFRAISLGLIVAFSFPGPASTDGADCVQMVRDARSLVYDDPARASELLKETIDECGRAESVNLRQQEVLRWEVASLNLRRAEEVVNSCQKYELGQLSVNYWLDYVQWYDSNEEDLIAALGPQHVRIQQAVRHLGNSIIVRGRPVACPTVSDTSSIRELFSIYRNISIQHFSTQTQTFWKEWLWKCPDWEEDTRKSYFSLRKLYCGSAEGMACEEEWRDYQYFLESWLKEKGSWLKEGRERDRILDLSPGAIDSARRELERIKSVFEPCENR